MPAAPGIAFPLLAVDKRVPMPITWSTRYTLEVSDDRLVIRGRIPNILWPTVASALMAGSITWIAFGPRFADSLISPVTVSLLGSIWFSAIFFGLWLTAYFSSRKPVVLDRSANQLLRGTSVLCPLIDIGWVEVYSPKEKDKYDSDWVLLRLTESDKQICSFVPLGDAQSFADELTRFLRVELRTTDD